MIAGDDIPDIPDYVVVSSLRVHAPTSVIFVCGGEVDLNADQPRSLRDALLRVSHRSILAKYDVHRAEEMEWAFPHGEHVELLEFEADIAQISDLIILFSESPGSLTELGAFSVIDEIARRMLVFVDDKNFADPSFIKLGPLNYLMHTYGEDYVSVLQLLELDIETINRPQGLNLDAFNRATDGPLAFRLRKKIEPSRFDKTRNGHVTKLITGLIQHYAALTLDEIDVLLYCMDITIPRESIRKHLSCAELVGWVLKEKRGIVTYFAAIEGNRALHFDLLPHSTKLDRTRWRADILGYWKNREPDRFASIQAALRRSSA